MISLYIDDMVFDFKAIDSNTWSANIDFDLET